MRADLDQPGDAPLVVVTGDFLGDRVADALAVAGCEVARGPVPVPRSRRPVLDEADWPRLLPRAAAIVVSPRDACPREMLLAAPLLRGVVSTVIGVDTIDMPTAEELGLLVGYGAMPENYLGVAEATVMFITALSLEARRKERMLASGEPFQPTMFGHLVTGRTVGLIGFGRIGRAVAERLTGWGVEILAFDPYAETDRAGTVTMVDLPTLLRRSDFVSLHTTLDASTTHLIGRSELATMKRTAYLINTARGALVDEEALIEALERHVIAGAALDVFEHEPLDPESPLRRLDNVILTPHMIGHSDELLDAIGRVAAENTLRLIAGRPPLYVNNPDVMEAWRERLASLPEPARVPPVM